MLHEPRNGYMEKDVTSLLPNFFTDDWRDDWGGDRSWNPLEPRSFSGLPPPIQPPKEWNERAERTPSPLRRMDWAESFVGTSGRGRMEVPDVGIIGQAVGADRRAGQGSPGAVGASLLRSIQNHQAHQMTSAKEMSAAPYRPGELLSKAMTQETSDAQIPTNSAASFDMKGHKAAAEAHCEVSPDERDDDDDDDDDDYSDSEDAYEDGQRPVPPGKVDGQQLNVGSTGHHLRLCKPCAFWNTKGCKDGKACKFCHLCEPGEKKRRKKEKSAYIRNISRWRQTDPPPAPAAPPSRAPGPPGGPPGPPIGGPGPSLPPRR
mmetsp:Transcript_88003/g.139853  ORF Transcript_88003/g.139853 Transcript_88003/m.139853 type:complete len:318 (-) Transcript_88003:99-1052(-)